MRTTTPKHSKIDATPAGIPALEPVFLLRAQDVHAQAAVKFYADRVQAAGGDPNVISAARASVTAFAAWPTKAAPTFDDAPADGLAAAAAAFGAATVAAGETAQTIEDGSATPEEDPADPDDVTPRRRRSRGD